MCEDLLGLGLGFDAFGEDGNEPAKQEETVESEEGGGAGGPTPKQRPGRGRGRGRGRGQTEAGSDGGVLPVAGQAGQGTYRTPRTCDFCGAAGCKGNQRCLREPSPKHLAATVRAQSQHCPVDSLRTNNRRGSWQGFTPLRFVARSGGMPIAWCRFKSAGQLPLNFRANFRAFKTLCRPCPCCGLPSHRHRRPPPAAPQ
eukprot:12653135-Alexandrium_andersonii.AAC.1